jgi:hypothetical protein
LKFIWIFSGRNRLKINISHILNPNLTKSWNPAHQDLSNNTKGTFQFLRNFQLQWRNHSIFTNFFAPQVQVSWNQSPCTHPLIIESFPKTPRTQSEASWFSESHNYKTEQSKLPSFIDKCVMGQQGRSVVGKTISCWKCVNSCDNMCVWQLLIVQYGGCVQPCSSKLQQQLRWSTLKTKGQCFFFLWWILPFFRTWKLRFWCI